MSGLGLTFLRRGGQAHPTAGSDYIRFRDEAVFNVLMANGVSSDGVGITKDDAAAVTSIGTWFQGNTEIEYFDEFEFFTGVTKIGSTVDNTTYSPFYNCTNLKSIVLPKSLYFIGTSSFQGCTMLDINLENENVTEIRNRAFYGCSSITGNVHFPNLEILGVSADASVFYNCTSLESITSLGAVNTIWGYSVRGTFMGCTSLKYVVLPDGITIIYGRVFSGCSALENLVMSTDAITTIGESAFFKCSALKGKWSFPSLTSIGQYAFRECGIEEIDMPVLSTVFNQAFYASLVEVIKLRDVTTLQYRAFYQSKLLKAVIIDNTTPPSISNSFDATNSTFIIYVPDESIATYQAATGWSSFSSRIKGISEYQG